MELQCPAAVEVEYAPPAITMEKQGIGDLLAVGFGTTVAMWAIGYICRMPGVQAAPQVVVVLWLACLLSGGFVMGRFANRGWVGGVISSLIAAVLNLLILGSVLTKDQSLDMKHAALIWLAGFFGVSAMLGGIGGMIGTVLQRPQNADASGGTADAIGGFTVNWKGAFAWVAVATTGLLIFAGGLVTGFNAGLAVPDWPTSFEANMFLFPLSRMTHGIYFEHAHRLLGSLVGFTCLTLAIYTLCVERRRWVVALIWITGCIIGIQAVLGGVRVLEKSREIAVVHGVLAQLVLGTLVAIAVLCMRHFASNQPAQSRAGAAVDQLLSKALVAALVVQLILGALVRHENFQVLLHISMAVVVTLLVLVVGMRALALNENISVLRNLGLALLVLVGIQVVAGINALVQGGYGDLPAGGGVQPTVGQALATTLHQTNGSILLACAVATMLWSRRLLAEPAK